MELTLCVFCGSKTGIRADYVAAARHMADVLAGRGIGLVYGGGRVGLMGTLADRVLASGGRVVGVIPRALFEREVAHEGLSELHVVDSLLERKELMIEISHGFVALPGGMGTADELFEVLTWAQLGLHRKPCGLLNAAGYFDPLLQLLDSMVGQGFLAPEQRDLLRVDTDSSALVARMLPELLDGGH